MGIRAFTTAPVDYDYGYTTTLTTFISTRSFLLLEAKRPWRLVETDDEYRFLNYQIPRYGSGMHPVYILDSPEAVEMGFPSSAKLDALLAPVEEEDDEEDEYTHGPLEEECAACGTELHSTHGEYGEGNDDIVYPSWRVVFDHVAERIGVDEGCMACRECIENGTDFEFSVDCLENGEGDEHNAQGGAA